ncbi:MAG TPA: S1 RNA-binding domain-containing protein [Candidatus Binatia bacterium]|nr:S1 RNA-binding domain-containing protein [Candidatus Binatia bacterium]
MSESERQDPAQPEEPSFAQLLAEHEATRTLSVGDTVTGKVLQIGEEHVFVDVSGKGEAVIPRAELVGPDGALEVALGDPLEATVVAVQPELRLSRKLLAGAGAREMLRVAAESGIPVEGRVAGVVKGGFEVTVAGMRAFCPLSQMDVRRVEDQSAFLGQTLPFLVIELKEDGRRIVLSRRRLLAEEAKRQAEETRARLKPGAVLQGRVVSIAAFGAFIDVGGVQGLVHLSEISHRRVDRASDALELGQEVTVQVLKVDSQNGKLALSMKALEGDPWGAVGDRLQPRQVVDGRVVRVADFGVFVELAPGIDGLLHVSELPHGALAKLREAARVRAELSVVILEIDPAKRRIALALAPQGAQPGEVIAASRARAGDVVTGTVEGVKPFGVVLRFGPGQTGVVPNNETGVPRGADLAKEFPAGSELTAEVTAVEMGGRRLRLSRAKALRREEQAEIDRHGRTQEKVSLSTFGDLLRQAQEKRR